MEKRKEVGAHQSQLRIWKKPPLYLRAHPVYELCRLTTSEDKNIDSEDIINLKEKAILLVEERVRKRENKRVNVKIKNEYGNIEPYI